MIGLDLSPMATMVLPTATAETAQTFETNGRYPSTIRPVALKAAVLQVAFEGVR
jgi:hypothetical protein